MQRGKQNNILQQKLDELTTPPAGVDFNASNAWQKLEKELRLQDHKPERIRKRMIVWLAAAAVFVGVIGAVWILGSDEKVDVVAKSSAAKQEVIHDEINATVVNEKAKKTGFTRKRNKASEARNNVQHSVRQQTNLEKRNLLKKPVVASTNSATPERKTSNGKPQTLELALISSLPKEKLQTTNYKLQTASVAPVRKFRIVHINETLPQRVEVARNHTSQNMGFPFYKQPAVADNLEETLQNVTEQSQRKREWGLIKTLTNSIKD